MVNDASRVFFDARVQQDLIVELCDEMKSGPENNEKVGWFYKIMCGTKAVALTWQPEVQKTMRELGLIQGKPSSVLFLHAKRRIRALVHRDDVGSSGVVEDLV